MFVCVQDISVWTNGPEGLSRVSPDTGFFAPWMAPGLPSRRRLIVLPLHLESRKGTQGKTGRLRDFLSSPDFPEISGICWNLGELGEIREISEKFRGTQWNSVGFCMALSMNSVGIPGGFRGGNAGFRENLGFGVVSGDSGSNDFCARHTRQNHMKFLKTPDTGRVYLEHPAGCPRQDVSFLQ